MFVVEVKIPTAATHVAYNFETHAEASRFVRECLRNRFKAQLVTKLNVSDRGNLGGYGGVNALRPGHCL